MGPLEGKRIIEFAGLGAGPFCGMLLADMGAEVIVIDRNVGTSPGSVGNLAPEYSLTNRGKQSVALDLKQTGAVDVVLRILRDADGLIEGFRPGVMERLGLAPEVCFAVNPKLAFGRMTGWGQSGPLAQAAGHDLNYIALSGALHFSGRAASPPMSPATIVGDVCGGAMMLAIGMLAAMLNAQSTGKGQIIDAAMTDGSALATSLVYGMFKNGYWALSRESNPLDGGSHWYDCYECADGKYVSLGALEPEFYGLLLDKLGLGNDPEFSAQHDAKRWPELKRRFAEIFKARTREQWCDLLEGSDVCFAPVLDFEEAPEHPHNRARGVFTSIAGVTQPAPAPRFSETASEISAPPPNAGQDTEVVLREAGYSSVDIRTLHEQRII
ncbi:MAG: CaiB/BaiF CoA transferase family protein [Woeseiaceae bacterium]